MATIKVVPGSPTAIQDAVNLAREGDVILVHKGVYHEQVKIEGNKDNIRIVAEHKYKAVLDGRFVLREAFTLESVAGVEIDGFKIKNYSSCGIRIVKGKSHRVLENEISDITGKKKKGRPFGIHASRSEGNLLMRNKIERIGETDTGSGSGIQLSESSGNWIVRNKIVKNSLFGIETKRGSHNAIVENRISDNKSDGIKINRSDNSLIIDNKLEDNGGHGMYGRSKNNLVIDSKIKNNHKNGLKFSFNYNLAFGNNIKDNRRSGVAVDSDFNEIQRNDIKRNKNNGISIRAPHKGNFVFENRLKGNTPKNIKDRGKHNNILRNKKG
ncbi:right-handed parallel beta-helix repeat-containing protein [Paenibacillus pasadenensis]|uniref:right-handed parallel beta-helix repeat-containing protein n=1 Tax=Paenibacillus pasadenensis TaxID=217090 RepID=UPI00203F5B42|nr:right-handed parallel beta-helix repeat-containing protein [Paenibacillus pasadenensis]MCM3749483.1 right-handed parallel beta-helix repeat-containing protein [Paenibacillus pasadenensis]